MTSVNYTFSVAVTDWSSARAALFTDDGCENAGAFLCGIAKTEHGGRLLAREFIPVPADLYRARQPFHLEIAPQFYNDLITRCEKAGLHLVIVHSHPMHGDARYSASDDHGESRLLAILQVLLPQSVVASLVVTRDNVAGRRFLSGRFATLSGMRVVGSSITSTHFTKKAGDDAVESRYDRQVRAFGEDGQRLLGALRVAVVGLGGTGSIVAEQLARIGVGHLVLIDYDQVDETNLTRILGARDRDVGRPKVSTLRRHLSGIARGTVEEIYASALKQETLMRLRDCDAVFSCVDNDRTRAVLNRFAYQYQMPVIDMGVRIDARGGYVSAAAGRVSVIGNDLTCLRCSHHLSSTRILAESLPVAERESLAKEGYVMGVEEAPPTVISLNTVVAGLGVTAFLNLFAKLTGGCQPADQMYDATSGSVFQVSTSHELGCDVCDPHVGLKALGDAQVVSAY